MNLSDKVPPIFTALVVLGFGGISTPVAAVDGPLDELTCSGLKRVGFTDPVNPVAGFGPLEHQGAAIDIYDQGDFGVFLLEDEQRAFGAGGSKVYDYIMSGRTYRATVYCNEVVCPFLNDVDRRIDPLHADSAALVSLFENARDAGCLRDPSRPVESAQNGR